MSNGYNLFWDLQKQKCVGDEASIILIVIKCLSISWTKDPFFFSLQVYLHCSEVNLLPRISTFFFNHIASKTNHFLMLL